MPYISTKGKFHCALNGVGVLLQGAPGQPAYQQGQAPVYGQRFASGDRSYNDLSQWWYFVQTDWSGGVKDSVSWADDANYYYSTNIDTWSEVGAIKLLREQYPAGAAGDNDFTYEIICGHEGQLATTTYKFIGTSDESDARPHIWRASTGEDTAFTDISATTIATSQNNVSQLSTNSGILWASTVGNGATWVVITYDNTTWVDQSNLLYTGASLSFQPGSSRAHVTYLGVTYVLVDDYLNNKYALVKTSTTNPSLAAHWTKAFEVANAGGIPVACAGYNGNIYYLVNNTTYIELWAYNVAAATNTLVRKFNNATSQNWGVGDKLLVEMNGKLIITIPNNEVWELNLSTLTRIFIKDEFKRGGGTLAEIDAYLYRGCVVQDNKAWWGNLMYDGVAFHNTWKNDADSDTNRAFPLFADSSVRIWETHTGDNSVLWSINLSGTVYKGTADKNFIVLSNFDTVSGVEKLAFTTTILFKPLTTGQKISVEYLTGEFTTGATWTALGNASYATDGGTMRSKTLFFPDGTTFNKLWVRIKLEGPGTTTPTMTDIVTEYLPVPTYKKNWTLSINAGDEVNDLSGNPLTTKGRELKALLEQAWWTKSVIDFQDFDYATTTVDDNPLSSTATTITVPVGGTADFPEQGRLRIGGSGGEEIFYTGKTPTTFTGCTRGARNTRARSHTLASVIDNAYEVLITDFSTRVPVALEAKEMEYIVGVSLREA